MIFLLVIIDLKFFLDLITHSSLGRWMTCVGLEVRLPLLWQHLRQPWQSAQSRRSGTASRLLQGTQEALCSGPSVFLLHPTPSGSSIYRPWPSTQTPKIRPRCQRSVTGTTHCNGCNVCAFTLLTRSAIASSCNCVGCTTSLSLQSKSFSR